MKRIQKIFGGNKLLVLILAAVLAVAAIVYAVVSSSEDTQNADSQSEEVSEEASETTFDPAAPTACGDQNDEQIARLQNSKNFTFIDTQEVAEDVLARDGYQNDPTCMYVLVQNDIYNSDFAAASEKLPELERLYAQYDGYLGALRIDAVPPDFLEQLIAGYQETVVDPAEEPVFVNREDIENAQ